MAVDTDPERDEEQEELHGQMSFLDHLEELRKRIIHSLIAIGVAFSVCWYFGQLLFTFVARPISKAGITNLVAATPTEGFNLVLKLALMASIFVASPFRNPRYAILIAFIVAAVITPTTDIPNMMMMAVPMVGLYMLGVVVAYVFGKKRTKEPGD